MNLNGELCSHVLLSPSIVWQSPVSLTALLTLLQYPAGSRAATLRRRRGRGLPIWRINWQKSAKEIQRLIRAFNPWPVAYTQLNDKNIRIWQAQVLEQSSNEPAGTVISCDKKGIDISCGEGILRILKLQPSGSKTMNVAAFMNGHAKQLPVGSQFQNPA